MSDNLNDSKAWDNARRYASLLDPIPSSVSGAIKELWSNYEDSLVLSQFKMSERSLRYIKRVEKSAILITPLYFAATALFPEQFEELKEDNATVALSEILGPGLFASLLALVYMHRRLNKLAPAEEWDSLSKEYVLNMEVGYLVGSATSQIGAAIATLVGGIRFAALATLLIRDAEQYKRYRNLKKSSFDIEFEHERWGCDHGQISAYLLKSLGFPLDAQQVCFALRRAEEDLSQINKEFVKWRVSSKVIDDFKQSVPPSLEDIRRYGLELTAEDLTQINMSCGKLFESGSTFTWMFKGSKDLKKD